MDTNPCSKNFLHISVACKLSWSSPHKHCCGQLWQNIAIIQAVLETVVWWYTAKTEQLWILPMMDTACIVAAHGADLLPQSMGAYWMPCFMALSFHSWPQNKHLLAQLVLRSQIQDSGQLEQWIFHGHGWPSARYVKSSPGSTWGSSSNMAGGSPCVGISCSTGAWLPDGLPSLWCPTSLGRLSFRHWFPMASLKVAASKVVMEQKYCWNWYVPLGPIETAKRLYVS